MAESGTKAPAGRTLDYGLSGDTLNRVRSGKLAASTSNASRNRWGEIVQQVGKGTQAVAEGVKAGNEVTDTLNAKWKNAESTEGWEGAKPELKDQIVAFEEESQIRYQAAVKGGDRTKQAEILAEQAQRVKQFGAHNALGALVLKTREDIGFIDNDEAYSPEDQYFLASYADPVDLTITMDGSIMSAGVDYTDFPFKHGDLDALLADENSGYKEVDGKIIRSQTTSEITDLLGNATPPYEEAEKLAKEFNKMKDEQIAINKANFNLTDAQRTAGLEQTYAFNEDAVSSKFGQRINEGNQKKLIYAKLEGIGTFADDFMKHPDFIKLAKSSNLEVPIPKEFPHTTEIVNGVTKTFADADANKDGIFQASELGKMSPNDRKLILKELQKTDNLPMLKEYWGEWVMLKSKGVMGLGGVNTTSDTVRTNVAGGSSTSTPPLQGNYVQ